MIDTLKIQAGTKLVLEGLGIDLNKEDFVETPIRMAKAYIEMCKFLDENSQENIDKDFSVIFSTTHSSLISQNNIVAFSLCSHHLMSISYCIDFSYIPNKKLLGLSKIIKIIQLLARQPMSQEEYTDLVINTFWSKLNPKYVEVTISGIHSCIQVRSSKSDSVTTTTASLGYKI